jgi:hypothetical protein
MIRQQRPGGIKIEGKMLQSNLLEVNRTMIVHVKKDFDPEVLTHTKTLCGMAPEYATAGYNGEWELVHRLDTGQALHQLDVCPACLKVIQAYQGRHKRPTLP